MEVMKAIKTRRNIRRYKPTPVDGKTIDLVLEAARGHCPGLTPSAGGLLYARESELVTVLEKVAKELGLKVI